ncbi:hypothetical protein MKC73_01080 [[Clostridium] innocuum]|nr:hypothetical protein [[Clostridium] innocuum]
MEARIILTKEGIEEICTEARERFLENIENIIALMPEGNEQQKQLKETILYAVDGIKVLMPRYDDEFRKALIAYENKISPLVTIALEENKDVWTPSLGISQGFLDETGMDMPEFLERVTSILEAFGHMLYHIHEDLGEASKLKTLFTAADKKDFQA